VVIVESMFLVTVVLPEVCVLMIGVADWIHRIHSCELLFWLFAITSIVTVLDFT